MFMTRQVYDDLHAYCNQCQANDDNVFLSFYFIELMKQVYFPLDINKVNV